MQKIFPILFLVALASCCAPKSRESDAVKAPDPACAGAVLDALQVGDDAALGYSVDGAFYVVEFSSGAFTIARPAGLVTGGAPSVSLEGDKLCATGTLEGDACLSALWRKGYCWTLKSPGLAHPASAPQQDAAP